MGLIPEYKISEFRKLGSNQIKNLKSCMLTTDGEFVCIVIIPPVNGGMSITDTIKTQAEYLAASGNSVGGKEIEEV